MEGVASDIIRLAIDHTSNPDIKKGLTIALNVIESSGYYNLDDWEKLSPKEQLEEVKNYLYRKN